MNSGAHVSSIITRSYAPVPSRIDSLSFWYRFAFGSSSSISVPGCSLLKPATASASLAVDIVAACDDEIRGNGVRGGEGQRKGGGQRAQAAQQGHEVSRSAWWRDGRALHVCNAGDASGRL